MQNVRRHLILNKGDELFIYGYEAGQETSVLQTLIEQAQDERTDLDWFDVAVLELKLKESACEFRERRNQDGADPQNSEGPNRFQLPNDGPLWFMRDQFGPDGNRQSPG